MNFYVGLHIVSHAHRFERCMISVNCLKNRRSAIRPQRWMLDSGAFTRIAIAGEHWPVGWYAEQIDRWNNCGTLEAAVSQDWMCEPFVLAKTGLTVADHQRMTIERFDELIDAMTANKTLVHLLPVIQGYDPDEYASHVQQYGSRLRQGEWCGVGSVCKRNATPSDVLQVLRSIRAVRPDLRLHGFGLKKTALQQGDIRRMLFSADSMAWSYAARREGRNANCPDEAQRYVDEVERQPAMPLFRFHPAPATSGDAPLTRKG